MGRGWWRGLEIVGGVVGGGGRAAKAYGGNIVAYYYACLSEITNRAIALIAVTSSFAFHFPFLGNFCLAGSSSLVNWMSQFSILGMSGYLYLFSYLLYLFIFWIHFDVTFYKLYRP